MEILQQAIRKLANSMRIYTETHREFQRLVRVDKEEAVDNLDRALESKFEAFHSLYDVSKEYLDYFSHADTAVLILVRNAIHHRDHLLFKGWNQEMALDERFKNYLGAEFLLVDYPTLGSPSKMRYFYKLEDFYHRIDDAMASPYLEKKMGQAKRKRLLNQINVDLYFSDIRAYAESERYPIKQIYVNVIPVFISATCRVFGALKAAGVEFQGFDAKAYEEPFTSELEVDFSRFTCVPLRIT
ncbi:MULTISPECIES: hypothetical protein [Xanthomonas]|uniref:Uncharacterized protein n=1 Tax=Xanthomonas prunicola TaxID=2053930 RepID=A0A2N3RFV0_9XANT|nr:MULTISPECIES: hypothetical protein [Xanthomonas]PKV11362.1 hypothetical protein XpruCFBP8353_19135 [Xanthomonas prunicola]PKV15572.1 hypothetical protein XpruCFBP8354_19525 [Xanthomonas prunicola]PKV19355.1 hypothetical protein CVO74_20180 [Xanthomonas prunicola]